MFGVGAAVIPSTSPNPANEDACRMAAAQLQHDHSNWMVIWGCYTRNYVAFPLFAAPLGTILTAAAPADLAAKIHRQERLAGAHVPQPGPAPDWQGSGWPGSGWQADAGWQDAQGWPGRPGLHRNR